jgi:hypothetical protein
LSDLLTLVDREKKKHQHQHHGKNNDIDESAVDALVIHQRPTAFIRSPAFILL